jgi:hypothetical protein
MDGYSIYGSVGDVILINLDSSEVDPYLQLFNSSGTLVAYNDDYSGFNSYLSYTLPSSGTYYIAATEYSYRLGLYTINARKQTPQYTVSYNGNGGTNIPATQQKLYNVPLTLSVQIPSRSGYSFVGWATSPSSPVSYLPGFPYTANASVIFYAIWRAGDPTLTYDANGGSGAPAPQTGGALNISTAIPVRYPYTFLGWSSASNASTPLFYPGQAHTLLVNTTFYAIWQAPVPLTIGTGFSTVINYNNNTKYYSFTPDASQSYTFYSSNNTGDPLAMLYDSNRNILATGDDSNSTLNFSITHNLIAGETYILAAKNYRDLTGSYTTYVAAGLGAPDSSDSPDSPEEKSVAYGDFYADGSINTADATWLLRFIASGKNLDAMIRNYPTTPAIPKEMFNPENADFDRNGRIDSNDVSWLLRYIASGKNLTTMLRNYPSAANLNLSHLVK